MSAKIEKEFYYKGFDATILASEAGHRCGYVEIPKDHKLFNKEYYNEDFPGLEVHGGITYAEPCLLDKKDSWFIGFDCAHYCDIKDKSIMSEKYLEIERNFPSFCREDGILWDTEMVENELKKLIDQIC